MNIDERLERLTERHEALTQSVELLRLEGHEQNSRIDKLVTLMEPFTGIVQIHERRLNGLEGGGR